MWEITPPFDWYSSSNICTKNYQKWTTIVKNIIGGCVVYFFETHMVCLMECFSLHQTQTVSYWFRTCFIYGFHVLLKYFTLFNFVEIIVLQKFCNVNVVMSVCISLVILGHLLMCGIDTWQWYFIIDAGLHVLTLSCLLTLHKTRDVTS